MDDTPHVLAHWGTVDADLPRIDRAYDEFLVTDDGDEIVDATAGLVVVNLGHSVPVGDIAKEQLDALGFVAPTAFTTEPTERLAAKLTERTPASLDTAFFVSSGSQAIESALKLARVHHHRNGNPDKTTFVSRWQSYHGATLGALALSGRSVQRSQFRPLLKGWPHVDPAYPYRWTYDGTPAEQARAAARELDRTIRQEGPETVAGFVAEPISGSTLPASRPHPAYFEEVRRICDDHDVLFIADEVMTGFGRTGEVFAIEHYDVTPDLLVVGKGLSSGYAPISGVVMSDEVAATVTGDHEAAFPHGFTYGGNPVSCAIAADVLDRYTADVIATGRDRGDLLRRRLEESVDPGVVGEIRQAGLLLGVEFVADPDTKTPFDPSHRFARRVHEHALEAGVFVYPGTGCVDGQRGDHLTIAPPLPTSEDSIETIARTVAAAVDDVVDDLA